MSQKDRAAYSSHYRAYMFAGWSTAVRERETVTATETHTPY